MGELLFNAFVMNTASHIQHGLWRHPQARQADFNDVSMWIDLVRTLEEGLFDAAFFADVVGLYGPVGGDYEVNVREGLQIPSNDPSVLMSALAVSTTHLGLAFTSSVLQAHPFEFARRASTLDHISNGRIAWKSSPAPRKTPHATSDSSVSPSTMTAMSGLTNISRSSTSYGRVRGTRVRCSRIECEGFFLIIPVSTKSTMSGSVTALKAHISRPLRRSEPLCCSRRVPRQPAESSPLAMPKHSSS